MFEMGFWEVILIFVIMLIVVGPERLPKIARTAGIWIGKARSMVASVRSEVEQELRVSELKQSLQEHTKSDEFKAISDEVKGLQSDMQNIGSDLKHSIDKDTKQISEAFDSAQTDSSHQSVSTEKQSNTATTAEPVTESSSEPNTDKKTEIATKQATTEIASGASASSTNRAE